MDSNWENRRTWRQSRSRERDRDRRSRSLSSSRSGSRTSTNRDRIRCFKCGEYDHFANECPNLIPDNSFGKVIVPDQYHCIWQIVIQDWMQSNI